MSKNTTDTGRESGTGQDTPTVCVHVPPRFPVRRAGHSVTMSRPVPLSRIGGSPFVSTTGVLAGQPPAARAMRFMRKGRNAKCRGCSLWDRSRNAGHRGPSCLTRGSTIF